MKSHETAFHVINCHVPVCHAVVPSRKWTMWLFRYVIVISYKCSITSTEVAPQLPQLHKLQQQQFYLPGRWVNVWSSSQSNPISQWSEQTMELERERFIPSHNIVKKRLQEQVLELALGKI